MIVFAPRFLRACWPVLSGFLGEFVQHFRQWPIRLYIWPVFLELRFLVAFWLHELVQVLMGVLRF